MADPSRTASVGDGLDGLKRVGLPASAHQRRSPWPESLQLPRRSREGLCTNAAAQLVGHETTRFLSLTLQELSEESPRRTPVPTGLDEKVNQVTVLVHGAPQILALTVDRDEDCVQKPRISESTLTALQPPGVIGAERPAPLPNRFVRHDDAAFGQQILDIPEAQAVSVIHPDGVADDFRRKAMPKVAGSSNVHPGIVPRGELT